MFVDMTRPDADLTAGIDLWQVRDAKEKTSQKGAPMLALQFVRCSGGATLYDNILLDGGGWPIGKRKLTALGLSPTHRGDIEPAAFLEKRVWLATMLKTYNGRDSLVVDIGQLKFAGYQPEGDPPPGRTVPVQEDLDVPF